MLFSCCPMAQMRVLHHVDDALLAISQSLLLRSTHQLVLIKIVNESGEEELHVFKVDAAMEAIPIEDQMSSNPVIERHHRLRAEDVQRAQQQRIQELELALHITREELRRALQRTPSPAVEEMCDSSCLSIDSDTVEVGASDVEVGVSLLQLVSSEVQEKADDVGALVNDGDGAVAVVASTMSDSSGSNEDRSLTSSRRSLRLRKSVDRPEYQQTSSTGSSTKRKSVAALDEMTAVTSTIVIPLITAHRRQNKRLCTSDPAWSLCASLGFR